jgi:hypothetical protein
VEAAQESDLAIRHDQDLGRAGCRMGISRARDRLLHAGDHGIFRIIVEPKSASSRGASAPSLGYLSESEPSYD